MEKFLILFFLFFLPDAIFSQHGDPSYLKTGYLNGNEIKISFHNDGALSGVLGNDVRGVWKNTEYISSLNFVLGLELPPYDYNSDGIIDTIHSVIIHRGPRTKQAEERSPVDAHFWGFNPLPGYANVLTESPAVSNNPATWPESWADHPEWGSNVWYGLNGANNFTGDMEGFFKIDDYLDDEVQYRYGFIPNPSDSSIKGHGIDVSIRYIQFNHPLFKDILFAIYDIKNTSERIYNKVFAGKILGRLLGGYGDSGDDLASFFPEYNSVLAWDSDFTGVRNKKIGSIGETIISLDNKPMKIGSFEFFNLAVSPDMSNDSLLWTRLTPGRHIYSPVPQDGEYLFGTEYFSLNPGETKRLVTALALDYSNDENLQKLLNAHALYNSNFNIDQTINSISFTNLDDYPELKGTEEVTWESGNSGFVDIFFKPGPGGTWDKIADSIPNTGSFSWRTTNVQDCALGKLKIFKKDSLGNYLSFNESGNFTINNSISNGTPLVKIISPDFDSLYTVSDSLFNLSILAGDPERNNLNLKIYYSVIDGREYSLVEEHIINSDNDPKSIPLDFYKLPNSPEAKIKVEISDGENIYFDSTRMFIKDTHREPVSEEYLKVISGNNNVEYQLSILDSSAIDASTYLLTFNDTSRTGQKYLSVFNVDKNQFVLNNTGIPLNFDAVFDGLSFWAKDFKTKNDSSKSRWNQDVSGHFLFQFNVIEDEFYPSNNGYRMPTDYQIEFFNSIVDTSIADTLLPITQRNIIPAAPVFYKVKNLSDGRYIKTSYRKTGTISTVHTIDFKENVLGNLVRTWHLVISGSLNSQPIQGDSLFLYTLKGFSIFDTLKISDLSVDVRDLDNLPITFELSQNYPNPFNPSTTIRYSLPAAGRVKISVYNVLGEKVEELLNKEQGTGYYDVIWNAGKYASGIYMYSIEITSLQGGKNFRAAKKMVLVK